MGTSDFYQTADQIIRIVGDGRFPKGVIDDLARETGASPEMVARAVFALKDDYNLLSFKTDMNHVLVLNPKLVGQGTHLYYSGIGLKDHLSPPTTPSTTVTNNVSPELDLLSAPLR